MKVITDKHNIHKYIRDSENIVACYGYFDGMHLGHKAILDAARAEGMKRAVVTFSNSPAAFCVPGLEIKRIMSVEDKIQFIKDSGFDYLIMLAFDEEMKNMTKDEFVDKYVYGLNVKYAVVGFNYTFGKSKAGNKHDFRKLCAKNQIKVKVMRPVRCGGEIISSTSIRRYIQNGAVKHANEMLGYYYSLSGMVIAGNKIGRSMGFPTANIAVDKEMLIPKWGVYHTNVIINGKKYTSLTNIGDNPTLEAGKLSIETYITDFDKNIYGQTVRIQFLDFIREEKKFVDKQALKLQIAQDLARVKNH